MSISFIRLISTICLIFLGLRLNAQDNLVIFHEPEVSINHSVSDNYKTNFSIAARHFMYRNNGVFFKNRHLQISHFSTLSLSYNKSISFGIMARNRDWFDESSNEIRLTQQFNYTKRKNVIRFGHRFRNEQRLLKNTTIHRLRYRLALDSPLQGEKLDVGESYIVANTEFLLSLNTKAKPEFDNRITSQIGWQVAEDLKLQIGLQYRFEAFNLNTENVLFLLTSAVLKI